MTVGNGPASTAALSELRRRHPGAEGTVFVGSVSIAECWAVDLSVKSTWYRARRVVFPGRHRVVLFDWWTGGSLARAMKEHSLTIDQIKEQTDS